MIADGTSFCTDTSFPVSNEIMNHFLFVVVLYNTSMSQSLTICSLLERRDLVEGSRRSRFGRR